MSMIGVMMIGLRRRRIDGYRSVAIVAIWKDLF